MSENTANMEDLAAAAGLDIQNGSPFDEAPEQSDAAPVAEAPAPMEPDYPQGEADIDLSGESSLNNESDPGEEDIDE